MAAKNKPIAFDALFLGPKSENAKHFQEIMQDVVSEHIYWRRDFHPEDKPIISYNEKNQQGFKDSEQKMQEVIGEVTSKLKVTSMPWHSPRYLGHMNAEVLMPSMLAYIAAMLYNPNNVAYEASTATSPMELEAGMDFARLMGYDQDKAWGHICTDGSIANLEAIWYARNLKSIPFAVKEVQPSLVEGMSDWQLSNMSVPDILDLADKVKDVWDEIRDHSCRGKGVNLKQLGKWIVPQTKHYSWVKAVDVMGIGLDNVIEIQVDKNYRMDIQVLKETIQQLADQQIPVMGVVGVIGSTEEGAIDSMDQIIELRREFEKQNVSFYVHADAAYGGYARSIFLDENYDFIPYEALKERLHSEGIINKDTIDWPSKNVYNAFHAMSETNSITIDPHKMGYVPYSAGGIVVSDKRMLDAISFFAAYVFEKGAECPSLLGSYILEGSKAGATAAAVWAAHRVLPLNIEGYGALIGASVEGAQLFYKHILATRELDIHGTTVLIEPLVKPDFNMVDFAFNIKGNTDLEAMNELNLAIYNKSSYVNGPVLLNDFITSHTTFSYDDYKDAPAEMASRLGIPKEQWDAIHSVRVMRACVLTPYFTKDDVAEYYWINYIESMKRKLAEILAK
ncbi:tyrosine decarboxylase [Desulforhopalus vacuolatus]|uniref:pyridoxal-dependent decarboxylase n=1 Tax=Desulforhopalus vacuolatus TaxID=40414 RepID=UPI0019637732|nr:pyridoxal-dependent decarboxylase [Desulforhopalus vacuolatus]MBM9520486.1 tyrosine decarboxylase [Desulforhopalus vacuolatus]